MILREGMETALLVSTALFQMRSTAVVAGLGMGLAAAILIAFAWTRLGRGVDLRGLLNVSAIFLAIFLVQLILYGVHELSEAGVFPASRRFTMRPRFSGPTAASDTCSRTRSRSCRRCGSRGSGGSAATVGSRPRERAARRSPARAH